MQTIALNFSGSRSLPTRRYHSFAPSLPAGYGHGQAAYFPNFPDGGTSLGSCLALSGTVNRAALLEYGALPGSTPGAPKNHCLFITREAWKTSKTSTRMQLSLI